MNFNIFILGVVFIFLLLPGLISIFRSKNKNSYPAYFRDNEKYGEQHSRSVKLEEEFRQSRVEIESIRKQLSDLEHCFNEQKIRHSVEIESLHRQLKNARFRYKLIRFLISSLTALITTYISGGLTGIELFVGLGTYALFNFFSDDPS